MKADYIYSTTNNRFLQISKRILQRTNSAFWLIFRSSPVYSPATDLKSLLDPLACLIEEIKLVISIHHLHFLGPSSSSISDYDLSFLILKNLCQEI